MFRTVMSEMGMAMMGTGSSEEVRTARAMRPRRPFAVRCSRTSTCTARRGILVNVTAGPDLTIGEFADVGETIDEFASEQATVVVGTVIDRGYEGRTEGDRSCNRSWAALAGRTSSSTRLRRRTEINGEVDYAKLDRPTVMRQQAARHHETLGGYQ